MGPIGLSASGKTSEEFGGTSGRTTSVVSEIEFSLLQRTRSIKHFFTLLIEQAFLNVHRYVKELELALELAFQKMCFRFVPDCARGKDLRYIPNQRRLLYKSSR